MPRSPTRTPHPRLLPTRPWPSMRQTQAPPAMPATTPLPSACCPLEATCWAARRRPSRRRHRLPSPRQGARGVGRSPAAVALAAAGVVDAAAALAVAAAFAGGAPALPPPLHPTRRPPLAHSLVVRPCFPAQLFVLDAVVAVPSETADAAASSFETVSTLAEPANVVNSFLRWAAPALHSKRVALRFPASWPLHPCRCRQASPYVYWLLESATRRANCEASSSWARTSPRPRSPPLAPPPLQYHQAPSGCL